MPELTREEKLNLVEKLPQNLRDLLYSEDTGALLLYLGKKYNLPDESVRLLSKLVGDVVLGIVPITSLTQEINSKILPDLQAAANISKEVYDELLAPVMMPSFSMPAPSTPAPTAQPATPTPIPAPAPIPAPTAPMQPTTSAPVAPAPLPPKPAAPGADKYREPASATPEVVDLRKAPTPIFPPKPIIVPPPAAQIPKPVIPIPPAPTQPAPPPTLVRPAEPAPPAPLSEAASLEADLQKIQGFSPARTEGLTPPPKPAPSQPAATAPATSEPRPQYILRSSGAPPTDFSDNVLDLRKDKGEF